MALSNDTGILVLLVYWAWCCDLQGRLVIVMDNLDGIVLDVNTTCTYISHSCLEPMHSLTATQCPILSARVILKCWKHSMSGLSWAVRQAGGGGCVSSRHNGSWEQFFTALYWQPQASPWLKSTKACAHHITATNGLETLRPCPLSDATLEGSRLSGSCETQLHRICLCSTGVVCRNSFIKKEDETGDEEQHNYDHGHDTITMNRTVKKMTSWMIAI